jgi:hypothetical protein
MREMDKEAVPELVSVMFCATLAEPTVVAVKFIVLTLKVSTGAGGAG